MTREELVLIGMGVGICLGVCLVCWVMVIAG